ncbi:cGMP-dependent protein kinase [Pleodorina starrii]|uniref:cGMP-dependent protein kinase n=1 Tax=Pleodorina starrii TaxID=330485 RepID=A0A9W6BXV5_9CHLO|nr:cGMP-dependent protein kinase [Pleodorina starrii]GLC67275.1 cGMP-dependent protein kinase [Pleodorina starrii]
MVPGLAGPPARPQPTGLGSDTLPMDQHLLTQLSPGSLTSLTWLGEGAYGCVELCRVSVPIPIPTTPRDDNPHWQQHGLALQQHGSHAAGECSPTAHPTTDSCDDSPASLRYHQSAAEPNSSNTTTAAAGASEALLSPREEVVRPGRARFSLIRLHVPSSQPHDPPVPSPCDTPNGPTRPAGYLARLQRHRGHAGGHAPTRSSAPATALGLAAGPGVGVSVGALHGASPAGTSAAASGGWPATLSSAAGGGGGAFGASGGRRPRPCSSGSAAAGSSAPPSARSPRAPTQPSTPSASVSAAVLSNELVVAVKRVGFRGSAARSGGGREPDGCVACTGGAVGRGRGGPSRVKLNRMQAIELLQLARCRDCPFIVRVFGCVPDDPRAPAGSASPAGAGTGGGASPSKQSPRPSKSSPRRPPPASSSPSCRIVMEWAEGGDLGSLLKALTTRRGPGSDPSRERLLMSETSARFYTGCLLEALSFLHGKGLLHRDVKPANLLLASDGRAKLGDLGMVCHLDRDGLAVGRAGTPNYMAPEVWANGTGPKFMSYGANADLWSTGVCLYEMMTGRLPTSHPDEYLKSNWSFSPRQSAFSPELRDLLSRLLTPRPRRRLQSCAEVAAHPWFAGFDWQGLRDGTLQAPYVPAAHRPLGAAAAAAAAARLRQPPPGVPLAAAAGTVVAVGGVMRSPGSGGLELMPPLLEETALPTAPIAAAAAAATEDEIPAGGAAVASATALCRSTSTGTLRQSAPAAAAAATASASASPTSSAAAGPHPGAQGQHSASGLPSLESSSSGGTPPRPAPPAAAVPGPGIGASSASVWRSLGWPLAASRSAAVSASAPTSACSWATTSGTLPQRDTSRGSDGTAGTAASGGGGRGSGGGLGALGAALASALSPVASPKAARAAALAASGGATAGSVTGRFASAFAASANLRHAASSSGGGSASGARTASMPCSGDVSATPTPTTPTHSRATSAVYLSTAVSAATTNTTTACAAGCDSFPASGDSRTTAASICSGGGGAAAAGGDSSSRRRASLAGGSSAASYDSQAAAVAAAPTASGGRRVQLLSDPRVLGESSVRRRSSLQAAGAYALPNAALDRNGADLRRGAPLQCTAAAAAGSVSQSAVLSAVMGLQQHVQGLGPVGRRAGWWLQQRLADAAAMAAALPEQLQSAAVAAAAAVGAGGGGGRGGGAGRVAPGFGRRACRSDGGVGLPGTGSPRAGANLEGAAAVLLQSSPAFECDQRTPAAAEDRTADPDTARCVTATEQSTSPDDNGAAAPAVDAAVAAATDGGLDCRAAMQPLRRSTCGGGTGVEQERASCGTSSSPSVLQLRSQPSYRSSNAPDVMPRHGSDVATVLVVVRRSTGCGAGGGGGGRGGGGLGEVAAGAATEVKTKACGGPQRACPAAADDDNDDIVAAATCRHSGDVLDQGEDPPACVPPRSASAGGGIGAIGELGGSMDGAGAAPPSADTDVPSTMEAPAAAAVAAAAEIPLSKQGPHTSSSSSPPAEAPRRTPRHTRTGSFCFDPLEQSRPMGQSSGSPSSPPPSTQPTNPCRSLSRGPRSSRSGHARSPSFSFDVGGLLSAGLLLGGSPVLLAAAASSPTSTDSGDRGGMAAAATSAASSSEDESLPSPASGPDGNATGGRPGSVGAVGELEVLGHAADGSAGASRRQGPGFGGVVTAAAHWQLQQPQWQAAEAAVLLYAACVAVLVMAWAVICEGAALEVL